MTEYLHQLLEWVSLHPVWAGIAVFLVAMSESLAIVGVLVPGVVLMFGFGAMISVGTLAFWPTFAWAVAGAIAGDGLSFFLGRHFQERLTSLWPFNKHPKSLERGITFFQRYGGKSVALGRFFGPHQGCYSTGGWHAGYAARAFPRRQRGFSFDMGTCLPAARHGPWRFLRAGLRGRLPAGSSCFYY